MLEITDKKYAKQLAKILFEIKSKKDGKNLLSHLNKLYRIKKEMNDDNKFDDLFEDISLRVKKGGEYEKEKLTLPSSSETTESSPNSEKLLIKQLEKAEAGAAQPVSAVNFVPDYVALFDKFSYCGFSFGHKESLLITNSLRNLSSKLSSGYLSFFGKIFCSPGKDYYIAEGVDVEAPGTEFPDPDFEKRREDGVNRNVYYVTQDLCGEWKELPDVTPSMIKAAREVKYIFRGDLEGGICVTPEFKWQEKYLLRCQIARIYHGAKLVPSINHYTIEDPESPFKPLTPSEKPKKFTHQILSDLRYWIHYPPGILKNGRISHIIDDPPEGVEAEEHKKNIMNADPFDIRMGTASEDKKIRSGYEQVLDYESVNAWRIDEFYEDEVYVNPYVKMLNEDSPDFDESEQKENQCDYSLISVRSFRWPGAINLYTNKESYFFYVGNGMKADENWPQGQGNFKFREFPSIPKEIDDKEDNKEPN